MESRRTSLVVLAVADVGITEEPSQISAATVADIRRVHRRRSILASVECEQDDPDPLCSSGHALIAIAHGLTATVAHEVTLRAMMASTRSRALLAPMPTIADSLRHASSNAATSKSRCDGLLMASSSRSVMVTE